MQANLKQEYNMNVPRNLAHDVMFDVDPELLEGRRPNYQTPRTKSHFTSKGTNWVHGLDGHVKLMGYQNSTYFPLLCMGQLILRVEKSSG